MQIVVTPIGGGTAVTLGDDAAGAYIIDPPPCPVERRQIQLEALALRAWAFANGLGNAQQTFSWTVARQHASLVAAEEFVWTHAGSVPLNVSISLNDPDGTPIATYSQAVIVEVACVQQTGISTVFRYTVQGAVPSGSGEPGV